MRAPKQGSQHHPAWVAHVLNSCAPVFEAIGGNKDHTVFYQNVFWSFVQQKQNCGFKNDKPCPFHVLEERFVHSGHVSVFSKRCPCRRLYNEFETFLNYWPFSAKGFSPQLVMSKCQDLKLLSPWQMSADIHDTLALGLRKGMVFHKPTDHPVEAEKDFILQALNEFKNLFFGQNILTIGFSRWVSQQSQKSHGLFLNSITPRQTVILYCAQEDIAFGNTCKRQFVNNFSKLIDDLYHQGCALAWVGPVALFKRPQQTWGSFGYRVKRKEELKGPWSMEALLSTSAFDKLTEMLGIYENSYLDSMKTTPELTASYEEPPQHIL